ncbi:hypothetical protein QBC47DRAFT_357733 [Echria macrotheca]|uniref:Amidoligase n=1 Tax=Echria macrotheca TaxID=438768 RepID=A0AAJ0FGA2_9PEZI|nr:hypothetical protein QBC47DRAFT_357733 [Echria macrotheca]
MENQAASKTALTVGVEYEFLFGYLSLKDKPSVGSPIPSDDDERDVGYFGYPVSDSDEDSDDDQNPEDEDAGPDPVWTPEADPWNNPNLSLATLNLTQPPFLVPATYSGNHQTAQRAQHVVQPIHTKIKTDLTAAGLPAFIGTEDGDGLQCKWWKTHWTVKDDISVRRRSFRGPWGVRHRFEGVEVTSPILRIVDDDDTTSALDVIGRAAAAIKRANRVSINHTCGFHVHVGIVSPDPAGDPAGGWTDVAVKKLVTLIWLLDGRLEGLVRPFRHDPERSRWCEPVTMKSGLACEDIHEAEYVLTDGFRVWMPRVVRDVVEGSNSSPVNVDGLVALCFRVAYIWSYATDEKLAGDVSKAADGTGFGMSISLKPLWRCLRTARSEMDMKPTVKFRKLEGTLNPATATAWTHLCLRIVQLAADTTPAEFQSLVAALLSFYRPPPGTTTVFPPSQTPSSPRTESDEEHEEEEMRATTGALAVLQGGVLTAGHVEHLREKIMGGHGHFTCCDHSDPGYIDGSGSADAFRRDATGDYVPVRCVVHGV